MMTLNEGLEKLLGVLPANWSICVEATCWYHKHANQKTTSFSIYIPKEDVGETYSYQVSGPHLESLVEATITKYGIKANNPANDVALAVSEQ